MSLTKNDNASPVDIRNRMIQFRIGDSVHITEVTFKLLFL